MEHQKNPSVKRNNRLSIVLAVFTTLAAIGFYLSSSDSRPKIYEGKIYIEPASERAKEYLAFKLTEKDKTPGFMILVNDLNFYSRIESFVNQNVEVKAFLHFHEPEDFNKIEIIEIEQKKR